MRVLCLSTWPSNTAPGPRFRCEAYFAALSVRGLSVDQASFLTHDEYALVKRMRLVSPPVMYALIKATVRSLAGLIRIRKYDVVWLFREAAPIGPPLIEFLIARWIRKPIVFDFDDAIWLPAVGETAVSRAIRFRAKTVSTIRKATFVIAGNRYLADFARKAGAALIDVVPTSVDTNRFVNHRSGTNRSRLTVGWTGSRTTNPYLALVAEVLAEVRERIPFDLLIISDHQLDFPFPAHTFCKWAPDTEIGDLSRIDIGIMPLADTEWEKGKCGFKLVQYMALGIPSLASSVGANRDIVKHGADGFLCDDLDDWRRNLTRLLGDDALRETMGHEARARALAHFSTEAHVDRLAQILRDPGARSSSRGGRNSAGSERDAGRQLTA